MTLGGRREREGEGEGEGDRDAWRRVGMESKRGMKEAARRGECMYIVHCRCIIHVHVAKGSLLKVAIHTLIQNIKQHSTPKAVTFPRKNELPQVGLKPTTLYTPDRACTYMYVAKG